MTARRLEGRRALVTGAGSGLGRAISMELAAEGAFVACTDVDGDAAGATAADIEQAGGKALSARLDVTSVSEIEKRAPELLAALGGIDILVNNAGGTLTRYGTILDADVEYWERIMNLNLRSTFLVSKAVLPAMIQRRKGSIVNIASVGALISGRGFAVYGTAKAGVIRLTQAIAADFAADGIRANAICPGTIKTAAIERMLATAPDLDAAVAKQVTGIPMGRMGLPEEVARLAAFLASDDSSFMTGTVQVIDGGSVLP